MLARTLFYVRVETELTRMEGKNVVGFSKTESENRIWALDRVSHAVHGCPFFIFSSALANLAALTSGASVVNGSACWMNGC